MGHIITFMIRFALEFTMDDTDTKALDVLVIGAGFSGICCGIKLLEKGISNFRIVEKSPGIGGTWWDNTYPGAACDVPSHLYCYSFEPNPNWSRIYSPGREIQQYAEHCVDKYGVRPYIEHGREVVCLRLDEAAGIWTAVFGDGGELQAHHVINGGGGLHQPSWPDIPGRDEFAGISMHTARWNHDVDYAGKNIAVIGSAASAIQVVPEVAKTAASVTIYQRTPNYIVPRNDRDFTKTEKLLFTRLPWLGRFYRWLIFMRLELVLFPITRQGSWYGRHAAKRIMRYARKTVNDKSLHEHLKPDYALGCKRILVSDDMYKTLNRDNVDMVTTAIEGIEESGIRTHDGVLREADILVYATGYDIEAHMRSINVVGVAGRHLQEEWTSGPEAFNGCCMSGYPNYYMVTGPNTGVGTTSVVFMIEQEVGYILQLIGKAGRNQLISVRPETQAAYNADIHAALSGSVWASGCKSWYRRPDGKITTLYPNNAREFRRQLQNVDVDDFEVNSVRK